MTIPIQKYLELKDSFCLIYLGENESNIQIIRKKKKELQLMYPDIDISLCLKDRFVAITDEIKQTQLDSKQFGGTYIIYENKIEEFMKKN